MATEITEVNKVIPKIQEPKESQTVDWYAQYRALGASPQKAAFYTAVSEGRVSGDADVDFSQISLPHAEKPQK